MTKKEPRLLFGAHAAVCNQVFFFNAAVRVAVVGGKLRQGCAQHVSGCLVVVVNAAENQKACSGVDRGCGHRISVRNPAGGCGKEKETVRIKDIDATFPPCTY